MTEERVDFLCSVLVTAVEGGIGYWAEIKDYSWQEDENHNLIHAEVSVREDDSPAWSKVNLDTVEYGLERIASRALTIHSATLGVILVADRRNDASEIDADAADCIIQVALFGELRYG